MRDKEYSEWMGTLGFGVLRHANCCKIAFNGGWESRQTEVDELQKRVDLALEQSKHALQYVEDDMRGNFDFLQMAMIRTFKELEKTLESSNAKSE
ncbi:hypothetical protein [Acinetobacter higginsii]|uniref:hypothetical protein n=1 Tax=Acinetobacter higginsii TaxID=70347 RepID=UPI00300912F5